MDTENVNKNGVSRAECRYSFDHVKVDPANRVCTRDGKVVALTGKVFDVLIAFVENPGRLLEKDYLIERVWPNEFVEEGNLARNISTLRKALGDTDKTHKYIVTVQGRGYRFLPDVVINDQSIRSNADGNENRDADIAREYPIDHAAIKDTAPVPWSEIPLFVQMSRRPLFMSVTAFCLVGAAILAFRLESYRPLARDLVTFDHVQKSRLTQDGDVFEPVISPDGSYLAYVRLKNNEQRALCLRQIATGSVLDLETLPAGTRIWALAFAPDNRYLYYILKESEIDYGNVYRIPLIGHQPPYKLAELASGGLSVSPDGRQLAFTRIDRNAATSSIVLVDTNGEGERSVASSQLDSMFYSVDWSPDGNSLVYSFKRHENDREYFYLAEIPATGGTEVRIGQPSETAITGVKWLPDESGLLINAADETTRQPQIFNVSYPDGVRRRVTDDLNSYIGFSLTADGHSIVLPQINSNRQIWEASAGGEALSQILSGNEKHFDNVTWANDGSIVFDEDSNGSFDNFNIFRVRADGSDLQQLTFGPGSNSDPAVSPDGQTIVFVSDRNGKSQLWRIRADGRDPVQLTDVANNVIHPVYSPDGKYIYFSVSGSGQCHIWRIPAGGGTPLSAVNADVYRWALSPDGSSIAYSSYDAQSKAVRTRVHSLTNATDDRILDISPETWMEWSTDGRSLLFNTSEDAAQNIWRLWLDGGKLEPVTSFNDQQVFRFSWSPDGRNLACIRHTTKFDALLLRFN